MPLTNQAQSQKQTVQFLGLAFAGADMVLEVERSGRIKLALGAVANLTGINPKDLTQRRLPSLVTPADGGFIATLLNELKPGERRGPFPITLAGSGKTPQRAATIAVFRLPENGDSISCAVSLATSVDQMSRNRHGLVSKDVFEQAAAESLARAQSTGVEARLGMVEVPGLAAAVQVMGPGPAEKTMAALAASLRAQSHGGIGAAEVGRDRFALVSTGPIAAEHLTELLREASGQALRVITAEAPMDPDSGPERLKTVRHILDRFIDKGASTDFSAVVKNVARETARIRGAVTQGALRLSYQPIVSLDGQKLHHYEALARFDDERGPAETIKLAEELGLIAEFDLEVIKASARTLAGLSPSVRIATNISGASLMSPGFVEALAAIVSAGNIAASRLLLEITETSRIDRLGEAKACIARLRKAGHEVCLDDFGAGAASFEYLGELDFDFVKIDGRYAKGVTGPGREAVLIKHVAALCHELGVSTIAEMVETQAMAQALKGLGVGFGQGWAFGRPEPIPNWTPPQAEAAPAARRRGAVESWG